MRNNPAYGKQLTTIRQQFPITYSIKDACTATGLSRQTINRLINDGELKATKVRGRVLIYTESLLALLNAGQTSI